MPDSNLTLTISAQNLATQAFKQLQSDVRKSNEHLERIAQNTQRVRRNTEQLTRSQQVVRRLRNEYKFLSAEVGNTAAVTRQFAGAIQGQVRAQVDAAANLERLRVGLVSITGSAAAASEQYQRLVEVSRLPGINIENSLRATLQLQALGKSGEEATEVIREFGNALALSGTPPRELQQVINALRQMAGEGKIIQEDIAILTTRVAALIPHLKEAFGGTRAQDVREFFDAMGVDESEQADRFLRIVLDRLQELPRAGETAANAIENLGDTTQRVQAAIGTHFLPVVKEATSALEGLLMEIERDPQVARNIAILEAFAGTFLTVTAVASGFVALLPALGAGLTFLATTPIGLAITAVGALTAGLVALRVSGADLRAELERTNDVIEQTKSALEAPTRETVTEALDKVRDRQRKIREEIERLNENVIEVRPGRFAPAEESRINALRASLLETLPIVEQLSRTLGELDESATRAAGQTRVTLQDLVDDLRESATDSTQAISEALQRLDNFGGVTDRNLSHEDRRILDLAYDLGNEMIAIAESTSVAQIDANKQRVDALARDNSLILADNQQLQTLLLAAEEAFNARRRQLQQEYIDAIQEANRQDSVHGGPR